MDNLYLQLDYGSNILFQHKEAIQDGVLREHVKKLSHLVVLIVLLVAQVLVACPIARIAQLVAQVALLVVANLLVLALPLPLYVGVLLI